MSAQGDAAAPHRIGIFGGAFDPPHRAHQTLARAALDQLALDELRVLPTGQAWHKAHPLSAAEHRLAMTRLAFEGEPRVHVDARELHRAGPTYTIDTLLELRAEQPGATLLLIVGEDQARALPEWHRWPEIASIAIICIAQRPELARASGQFDPKKLVPADVLPLTLPALPVSATDIRARAAQGRSLSALVAPAVARYIAQHHLYRQDLRKQGCTSGSAIGTNVLPEPDLRKP